MKSKNKLLNEITKRVKIKLLQEINTPPEIDDILDRLSKVNNDPKRLSKEDQYILSYYSEHQKLPPEQPIDWDEDAQRTWTLPEIPTVDELLQRYKEVDYNKGKLSFPDQLLLQHLEEYGNLDVAETILNDEGDVITISSLTGADAHSFLYSRDEIAQLLNHIKQKYGHEIGKPIFIEGSIRLIMQYLNYNFGQEDPTRKSEFEFTKAMNTYMPKVLKNEVQKWADRDITTVQLADKIQKANNKLQTMFEFSLRYREATFADKLEKKLESLIIMRREFIEDFTKLLKIELQNLKVKFKDPFNLPDNVLNAVNSTLKPFLKNEQIFEEILRLDGYILKNNYTYHEIITIGKQWAQEEISTEKCIDEILKAILLNPIPPYVRPFSKVVLKYVKEILGKEYKQMVTRDVENEISKIAEEWSKNKISTKECVDEIIQTIASDDYFLF
jgi:hypothetical protein